MAKCKPCMGAGLKQLALEHNPELRDTISSVGDCKNPLDIVFCLREGVRVAGKRAPSEYNIFVKSCIARNGGVKSFSEAGQKMKQCAGEWRSRKGK